MLHDLIHRQDWIKELWTFSFDFKGRYLGNNPLQVRTGMWRGGVSLLRFITLLSAASVGWGRAAVEGCFLACRRH